MSRAAVFSETLNLYLNSLISIMHCLVPSSFQCGLRSGPISLPVVSHDTKELRSCSSFFVSDILYCCIKAMALSAESFTTVMVDAAIRKSWYEGSSHNFSGSFERKLCAFSFSFNCRTSKMTVVLSVKQEAKPAELRNSGGQTRRFTELVDCGRQRFVTICDFTSTPTMSSNNERQAKIS